jgi:hypothetical protein
LMLIDCIVSAIFDRHNCCIPVVAGIRDVGCIRNL